MGLRFYSGESPLSELIRHKHQIKHIHNPISVHVPLQTIRPEPLRDCLNQDSLSPSLSSQLIGFSRIKGFRGFAIALLIQSLDLIEFDQSSSIQPVPFA